MAPAYKLAALSFEALDGMRLAIESDPANANPACAAGRSIWRFTPKARKKLDALAWAVTYKLAERRRSIV